MRLQFNLLPGEYLNCSDCKCRMKAGDTVHIVPDNKAVIFNCWKCTKERDSVL